MLTLRELEGKTYGVIPHIYIYNSCGEETVIRQHHK